jgi:hypothetical protein
MVIFRAESSGEVRLDYRSPGTVCSSQADYLAITAERILRATPVAVRQIYSRIAEQSRRKTPIVLGLADGYSFALPTLFESSHEKLIRAVAQNPEQNQPM